MTSTKIAQSDLLCTNCAGQCAYTPTTGALTCQSCGTAHRIKVDAEKDPSIEQHYDPELPHTEQPRFTQDRPYQCQTCGGEVVFKGHALSQQCPYCNGALVKSAMDESYAILGMIPFAVGAEQAQQSCHNWISKRWAAPADLAETAAQGRVVGIYVPFWTFDSTELVNYTITYRVYRGKKSKLRRTKGEMRTQFDDLLMPASEHITPLIRDGILHDFDPADLRPFDAAYIAGFAAERHHHSVRKGLKLNESDKGLLLRNRIKSHSKKSNIVNISYVTDTSGIHYRRILLPVWIQHYQYQSKAYKIVTCGLKGRTFGERPFSALKLLALAALISAPVIAFGFFWGANHLY
ncbi:hypothetical protein GCM10007939_02810 [Amylibacter marinus]|uniref:Replication restart DNA helicase PriA n=1 Tax=Amylibacter marinus TaxID=1475483 RepID=A0ABQ5VRG1_9RHOB|nr:hypothetical protein [Amylibacter marinus]GLQ33998.1 hypothetical protein GCM10007939_02810 [Amylibacter marinus]